MDINQTNKNRKFKDNDKVKLPQQISQEFGKKNMDQKRDELMLKMMEGNRSLDYAMNFTGGANFSLEDRILGGSYKTQHEKEQVEVQAKIEQEILQ